MPEQTARISLSLEEAQLILCGLDSLETEQTRPIDGLPELYARWKHWIECNFDKPQKE